MKKTNLITISAIAACLALSGGIFYANHKSIVNANAETESEGVAEEFSSNFIEDIAINLNEYEQYKPFGLKYNSKTERFYYNDQLVRYFKDNVDSAGTIIGFSYDDGEIDIVAKRDSSFNLKGLEVQDQNEFEKRSKEVRTLTQDLNGSTSFEEGNPEADDSLVLYENYGIKYEKSQDLWSYDGQIIRALYDKGYNTYLCQEDAAIESGLSLIITRDKGGKISGIDKMTESQFNDIFN